MNVTKSTLMLSAAAALCISGWTMADITSNRATPDKTNGSGGVAGGSNCCVNNGTPGCDDPDCEAAVCAIDPFCCDTSWDTLCADQAAETCSDLCGGGGGPCPGEGDCCVSNGTPGCEDAACCETVCAADPFCCDTTWDTLCAGGAEDLCGDLCGGGGGDGDCCVSNGTPGCDDPDCEAAVCAVDPFCCDTTWDTLCADQAADLCGDLCGGGGGPCPGEGDCCVSNGTPGCEDAACCETVCAADPFCCDTTWDTLCAGGAEDLCGDLCGGGGPACPGEGDCCEGNGTPGCDDVECCETVCACDPFCCDTTWDAFCAGEGFEPGCGAALLCTELCGGEPNDCPEDLDGNGTVDGADLALLLGAWGPCAGCPADLDGNDVVDGADLALLLGAWGECPGAGVCGPGAGDCCSSNGTPGCDDAECCETVCAVDPFCCDTTWDTLCADGAAELCGDLCGGGGDVCGEGAGDCCSSNGTPGCDDVACCEAVCAADPFCCDTTWDTLCAGGAEDLCGDLCGGGGDVCGEGAGDCCSANGTPGCDDVACCETVCACDPFCCDTTWDAFCAGEGFEPGCGAALLCTDLCGGGGGDSDCCISNGTPGCDDPDCENAVCSVDPFCCDTTWDQLCADQAADICSDLCGGGGGDSDCCINNGTPGCDDPDCQAAVCAIDPFCCDVSWDQLCADQAAETCSDICG